ncbi:hypothetical protein TVAG_370470 [Trichomonas vaginalis G3]|uniref:CCZ1/INTU/HSP4 first Longin domain-containing protein n=1 Tax=Trichomonas vaginalis (strain ATCC PRA-98 / G3) TaxID=412133 RepID=A2FJP4_TRIV3|nr:hypothetical protein TVAGG3_0054020 [Trichomonas vaginalis G3]EAX94876.1 hypothetical protein TVAG_370470 [Trichomonas vaginalis G3]KAI5541500.1 hypothetical protein TVAGG3_0054020 [Trichomonas vaginalis G3]|eukprot:XP_001307806.1 hypothetical protein [Trichomonas vaginalis G3]
MEGENPADSKHTCFCVFQHNPFKRGDEGVEDAGKIIEQLIYKYPSTIPDRQMEHLLGVLIALYTFSNLSLNGKTLDFICWSNSKLAIQTQQLEDQTMIFFVLRAPSAYSDISISVALDHIKKGIFFALGAGINHIPTLQEYLKTKGDQILSIELPEDLPNPLPFSFTNLPNAEWQRSSVAATFLELLVMRMDPRIWGCACFSDNLLLVSHSSLDIISLFDFATGTDSRSKVYLTSNDRASLIDYKGSTAKIPEGEIIESTLLRFKEDRITLSVLASPDIDDALVGKISANLKRAAPQISSIQTDLQRATNPANTIVYDSELNLLRCGSTTPTFRASAIEAHDMFVRDPRLKDVIMSNVKEFALCMNVLDVEHYAAVPTAGKNLSDLYDEAIKLNPELIRYLNSIHLPD